jgi:hypothetical protein
MNVKAKRSPAETIPWIRGGKTKRISVGVEFKYDVVENFTLWSTGDGWSPGETTSGLPLATDSP